MIVALNVTVKAIISLQRLLSSSLFTAGAVKPLLSALQLPYLHHESYRTAFIYLVAFTHWPLRAGSGHLVWQGLQTRV